MKKKKFIKLYSSSVIRSQKKYISSNIAVGTIILLLHFVYSIIIEKVPKTFGNNK